MLSTTTATATGQVTAERSERGVVVTIDGEPFTEYLTTAGGLPYMWPLIGPTGQPMTRAYPVGPRIEGETTDHPHHRSLWLAHDEVGGADFWKANVDRAQGDSGTRIAHREFTAVESLGDTARIIARSDWMDGDRRICADQRTIVFGTRDTGDRWIDFTITIEATDGDVTFGDTKEGTFAVRVADTMRVNAKPPGRIVNSEGQSDGDAWGMPARWVDYAGPVDGETVGIAILSHPSSFRPVPRWHVRTYGLFTANPFGEDDFPPAPSVEQGAVTLSQGESLMLRYRVLLHRGSADDADIASAYDEFAAQ